MKYWKKYSFIVCDDTTRTIICVPPKNGCTYFKTMWVNLTRDVNKSVGDVHNPKSLKKYKLRYLHSYSESEIRTRIKKYFKIVVARHPMVRLLSAYRDKLEVNDDVFERIVGREIKKRYFPANQSKVDRVTFEQFVHYLVHTDPMKYDKHWQPIAYFCHLCEIQYDYIAKIETSHVDYPRIFSTMKNISVSKRNVLKSMKNLKGKTNVATVNEYYSHVPAKHLEIIENIYSVDMTLFGYTWNKTSLSYSCRMDTAGKECC